LAPLTTFKIGGKADYFCRVSSEESLEEALLFAKENNLSVFVLGGGSNLVVSDDGFRGMVIKVEILGKEISGREVLAGAGESWDGLVAFCLDNNLFGLENLSGIPGTVGGSAVQNIGAYGTEVKKFIGWVLAVNVHTGATKRFMVEECLYDYRHSFFKTSPGKDWVISKVCFVLDDISRPHISYKDLAEYFRDKAGVSEVTPRQVREVVLNIRAKKFPPLDRFGTAGSFFKNPVLSGDEAKLLAEKYPDLPMYDAGPDRKKVSLAWILDRVCQLKGSRVGNVEVSNAQALVLLSSGVASSNDVLSLARKIKDCVRDATGIEIEMEVETV
jgi:UDP-N-acetylmuramate dehydrogenase